VALVAAGWWAVHQLRYLLAYGAGAEGALHHDGHAYLAPAAPVVAGLLALAAARLLVRAAASPPARCARAWRLLVMWPVCAAALLGLYAAQELTEGMLASGHPKGPAGVVGHGGWIAVPVAIVAGLAIAAALRMGERIERGRVVVLDELADALPRPLTALLMPAQHLAVPTRALARQGAGRAPPSLCR
jgi:hypothetical protein